MLMLHLLVILLYIHEFVYCLEKMTALPNFTKFPLSVPKEYLKTKWKDCHKKGEKKSGTEIRSKQSGEPEGLAP